jgi:hypothetical protein
MTVVLGRGKFTIFTFRGSKTTMALKKKPTMLTEVT